jgi:CheY-like chemotaxis protein
VPKVMLFEDDEFLAEVYQKKFEESGVLVKAYTMPSDNFLADILEYNPDLIITNIIMLKMDGIELTREIKTDERTKKPVMFFLLWEESKRQDRRQCKPYWLSCQVNKKREALWQG